MRFLTQHFSRCSSRPSQNLPRVSSCRNARGGWQRGRAARSAALLALLAPYNKTSHVQGSAKANSEQPCFHTSRYTALAFSDGFLRVFFTQLTFSTQPHRGCSRGSSPPSPARARSLHDLTSSSRIGCSPTLTTILRQDMNCLKVCTSTEPQAPTSNSS